MYVHTHTRVHQDMYTVHIHMHTHSHTFTCTQAHCLILYIIKPPFPLPSPLPVTHTLTRKVTDMCVSNGMAWSPDSTKMYMYYIDSGPRKLWSFEFDDVSYCLTSRQVCWWTSTTRGWASRMACARTAREESNSNVNIHVCINLQFNCRVNSIASDASIYSHRYIKVKL